MALPRDWPFKHGRSQGAPWQGLTLSHKASVGSDLVDGQPVANGIQPARPRPRPMIDSAHAPKSPRALRLQMIEAGERAVLDQEAERHLRLEPQRHQQRHLDGPAMSDGNNVTAAVLYREAFDDGPHALDEIDEAFATWRAFVCRPEPQRVRADPALGIKGLALHALPHAQVLFGKLRDGERLSAVVAPVRRRQDRHRRLTRAREMARHPHGIVRQFARQHGENLRIRAIAVKIALTVDLAAIGNGSMTDPPPARLTACHRPTPS